jgi:hypothetical protein
MRRVMTALAVMTLALLATAGSTLACGGLIGPNGAVNLLRTTTFAGYHEGVEHYVTSFEFAGGGGAFGSITPLPGVPSSVERGGDWTLQRLIRETDPVRESFLDSLFRGTAAGAASAEVLLEKKIDALDITILKGGGAEVGLWAKEHGFRLPPDAPEVLDFYARRSPIFMAASFDADAAAERGQGLGDGTPIHVSIPTPNPWVPLRILGLGKTQGEIVEADVYLLTDIKPELLPKPNPARGVVLQHSRAATDLLLSDLRSDKGMEWVPEEAWLTKVRIDAAADSLGYDLAVDASGQGAPSRVAAGLDPVAPAERIDSVAPILFALGGVLVVLAVAGALGPLFARRLTSV